MKLTWTNIPGTPDYKTASGWRAVYVRTHGSGYAEYKTYRPNGSLYGNGGLPDFAR